MHKNLHSLLFLYYRFWQFSIINFCFFTLPHLIQRVYAARDLASLKVGLFVNCIGPWVTSFAGVFIGTMGVVMGVPRDVVDPFTAILEQVMNLGKHTLSETPSQKIVLFCAYDMLRFTLSQT